MQVKSHKDLVVWQKAMELVLQIYRLTRDMPKEELYGLTAQLRRAAVSIPANIAEGNARGTTRDYAHFISIARGSLAELSTLLAVVQGLSYVSSTAVGVVCELADEIGRMLNVMHSKLRSAAAGQ